MNWYNIHLRKLLLILITSLQIALPIAHSAAPVEEPVGFQEALAIVNAFERMNPAQRAAFLGGFPPMIREPIQPILEHVVAMPPAEKIAFIREAAADINESIDDVKASIEDMENILEEDDIDQQKILHKAIHAREVWLEKVEEFNKTPLVVLKGLGTVPNIDLLNEHFAQDVYLGIFPEDLLNPTFHFGSLLLDINTMADYFDGMIEAIATAMAHKEDVVLYNLNIMLETSDDELFAATFKNLNEALQKSMSMNNQMRRLAIQFFKNRVLPACVEHVKKSVHVPPFIYNRTPKDVSEKEELKDDKKIPVVSISNHLATRMVLRPLVASFGNSVDLKINEWVSGYKDKRAVQPLAAFGRVVGNTYINLYSSLFLKVGQGAIATMLEAAKQTGFAETFDETWWFTLSSELLFNLYFFHRTMDSMIKDQLLDMLVKESLNLKEIIETFERRLANPLNESQEKQLEIKQALKEEIFIIVMNHFGPLQPVLLEKFRKNHSTFETCTAAAMLAPVILPVVKGIWPLIRSAIN